MKDIGRDRIVSGVAGLVYVIWLLMGRIAVGVAIWGPKVFPQFSYPRQTSRDVADGFLDFLFSSLVLRYPFYTVLVLLCLGFAFYGVYLFCRRTFSVINRSENTDEITRNASILSLSLSIVWILFCLYFIMSQMHIRFFLSGHGIYGPLMGLGLIFLYYNPYLRIISRYSPQTPAIIKYGFWTSIALTSIWILIGIETLASSPDGIVLGPEFIRYNLERSSLRFGLGLLFCYYIVYMGFLYVHAKRSEKRRQVDWKDLLQEMIKH